MLPKKNQITSALLVGNRPSWTTVNETRLNTTLPPQRGKNGPTATRASASFAAKGRSHQALPRMMTTGFCFNRWLGEFYYFPTKRPRPEARGYARGDGLFAAQLCATGWRIFMQQRPISIRRVGCATGGTEGGTSHINKVSGKWWNEHERTKKKKL